jgi:hypothetical protein
VRVLFEAHPYRAHSATSTVLLTGNIQPVIGAAACKLSLIVKQ